MRPIVTDVLMFRGLSKCVSMFVGHNRESESYKAAEPTEIKFGESRCTLAPPGETVNNVCCGCEWRYVAITV